MNVSFVIPAKAGIQCVPGRLDTGVRRCDQGFGLSWLTIFANQEKPGSRLVQLFGEHGSKLRTAFPPQQNPARTFPGSVWFVPQLPARRVPGSHPASPAKAWPVFAGFFGF